MMPYTRQLYLPAPTYFVVALSSFVPSASDSYVQIEDETSTQLALHTRGEELSHRLHLFSMAGISKVLQFL